MGRAIIASIHNNEVKIVHTITKWNSRRVESLEKIPFGEFDDYLKREQVTEFTVVTDFDEAFHDIILVPPLKEKYLRKVVKSEIIKATGETDFTFIHSILDEKVVDNKKMLEVFYYMLRNESIHNVVERFYEHGKAVKALYPGVFSAAVLLDPGGTGGIKMGMVITGYKRIVFTTKNGYVNFIRDYDSLETSISDFDIQNINMTIDYFTKNMRMTPESVSFIGDLTGLSELKTEPLVPVVEVDLPDNIECECKGDCGYPVPCAFIHSAAVPSILSREFKGIYLLRRLMQVSSLMFIIVSVICLGLIFYLGGQAFDTKKELQAAAQEISGVESVYAEYQQRQEKLEELTSLAAFLNRTRADVSGLLTELSVIELRQLRFTGINAIAESDSSFLVTINGRGTADTYSDFQASFGGLVDGLEKIDNIELESSEVNHTDRAFTVRLRYGQ